MDTAILVALGISFGWCLVESYYAATHRAQPDRSLAQSPRPRGGDRQPVARPLSIVRRDPPDAA